MNETWQCLNSPANLRHIMSSMYVCSPVVANYNKKPLVMQIAFNLELYCQLRFVCFSSIFNLYIIYMIAFCFMQQTFFNADSIFIGDWECSIICRRLVITGIISMQWKLCTVLFGSNFHEHAQLNALLVLYFTLLL